MDSEVDLDIGQTIPNPIDRTDSRRYLRASAPNGYCGHMLCKAIQMGFFGPFDGPGITASGLACPFLFAA